MDDTEPTSGTQPERGEPIAIPVPARDEIETAPAKVARPSRPKPEKRVRKAKPAVVDAAARDRARRRSGDDGF
jgi:hypothetical protein